MKSRYFFVFLAYFILMSCHPIEYEGNFGESQESFVESSTPEETKDDFREGVLNFEDNILSNKLDLVIVLDAQEGMENFYEKNIFGSDFLNHFDKYDWRLAYTNTIVSEEIFNSFSDKVNKDTGPKNCEGMVSGGFMSTIFGGFANSAFFVIKGVDTLTRCNSIYRENKSREKEKKKGVIANGEFLSFEHDRKKVELSGNYLTKEVKDYQDIFNDTMMVNPKMKWFTSYEAPLISKHKSTPLIAALLSTSKQIYISEENEDGFFREDSKIIYVVVTPEDNKLDIEKEELKKSLGKDNRFHLIPVIIKSNQSHCQSQFSEMGVKEPKAGTQLKKISKTLNAKSVDICSPNLGEDLAKEITKNLHSLNF